MLTREGSISEVFGNFCILLCGQTKKRLKKSPISKPGPLRNETRVLCVIHRIVGCEFYDLLYVHLVLPWLLCSMFIELV
jgi:hypothetical protein